MIVTVLQVEKAIAGIAGARVFVIDKMRRRYGKSARRNHNSLYPAGDKQMADNNGDKTRKHEQQRQNAVMLFKIRCTNG